MSSRSIVLMYHNELYFHLQVDALDGTQNLRDIWATNEFVGLLNKHLLEFEILSQRWKCQ